MSGFDHTSGNQYLEVAAQVCFSRAEHWQKKILMADLDNDKKSADMYTALRNEAGDCKNDIRKLKIPYSEADLIHMLAALCNEMTNRFDNPIYASMYRMATMVKEEVEIRDKESNKCASL